MFCSVSTEVQTSTSVLGLAPNLELEDDKGIEQLLPENAPENCKANYRGK